MAPAFFRLIMLATLLTRGQLAAGLGRRLAGARRRTLVTGSRPLYMATEAPPASSEGTSSGAVDVIFADDDIVVVNKPSGLLSVPGLTEKDCMASRVQDQFGIKRLDQMVAHRLDQMTSGVMVFARNVDALRSLHKQFRMRSVRKEYFACCAGVPRRAMDGEVRIPIRKDMDNPPKMMVDHVQGKPSFTYWSLDAYERDETLDEEFRCYLRLRPKTGRSHQLRVHMMAIGCPILGDQFYATGKALDASERLLLHAHEIQFLHPRDKRPMMFRAPCDFWHTAHVR